MGCVRENSDVRIDEGKDVGSGQISQKTAMGINYTLMPEALKASGKNVGRELNSNSRKRDVETLKK